MYNVESTRLSNSDIQSIPKKVLQLAILDAIFSKYAVIDGKHASHTSHLSIPILCHKANQPLSKVIEGH